MTELLVIRDRMKKAYSVYGAYIDAAAKAMLVLFSCISINSQIGYMTLLQSPFIVLLLAVIAALLPSDFLIIIVSLVALGNLMSVTAEAAAGFFAIEVFAFLIYFAFKPGNSKVMAFSITLGSVSMYGPLPAAVGLMCSPGAIVPMIFGLIASKYISYVSGNYVLLSSKTSTLTLIQKITQIATGVFLSDTLWITVVILMLTTLVIYALRRLPVRYSWMFSIGMGTLLYLLLTLLCDFIFDVGDNYFILFVNLLLEVLTGLALMFFFFMVDYSREESVQFEDDDYYYYVKAVPKINMTVPKVKVTRIRERSVKEMVRTSDQVIFVKDDEEGEGSEDTEEVKDD